MAEVYSWPEARLFVFPAGGPSAILTFGRNVQLSVPYDWHRVQTIATGVPAARTQFNYADKDVRLSIGMLYSDQSAFFMANSATAFNARVVMASTGGYTATAEFQIWSAVFTQWSLVGQDNGLWQTPIELRAADISGI